MFIVSTNSPMDNKWRERDEQIKNAAGRSSDSSGAGVGVGQHLGRDHQWHVKTMDEAKQMKQSLQEIQDVKVSIREK